jgi:hypothetical protein
MGGRRRSEAAARATPTDIARMSARARARLSTASLPQPDPQPRRRPNTPFRASQPPGRCGPVPAIVAGALVLLMVGFLIWMQVQIARVMLYGVTTTGIVMSIYSN